MLNKTKLGLASMMALLSLSAYAEEMSEPGFYVELEGSGIWQRPAGQGLASWPAGTVYEVEFCGIGRLSDAEDSKENHHCHSKYISEEHPTFFPIDKKYAYLKIIKTFDCGVAQQEDKSAFCGTKEPSSHGHVSIIKFDGLIGDCAIDTTQRIRANVSDEEQAATAEHHHMTGYPLMEISFGEDGEDYENTVSCKRSFYFPHQHNQPRVTEQE